MWYTLDNGLTNTTFTTNGHKSNRYRNNINQ